VEGPRKTANGLQLSSSSNGRVEAIRPLIDETPSTVPSVSPLMTRRSRGDLTRSCKIVSNLLNNAAKYTDEACDISSGGLPPISVEEAVVRVRDNGMGSPRPAASRVRPFHQAERAVDRSQGDSESVDARASTRPRCTAAVYGGSEATARPRQRVRLSPAASRSPGVGLRIREVPPHPPHLRPLCESWWSKTMSDSAEMFETSCCASDGH
jgi:hypothetical protein